MSRAGLLAVWAKLAPAVFVLLWGAGFVGAKYGLPYAPPMTFLTLRMLGVIAILGALVVASRAPWPGPRAIAHAAIAGLMLQAAYLGGVFTAISFGFPAGMVSLVAGLQPVLTAALAPVLLRERISRMQWLGFVLGFAGVLLVVWTKLAWSADFYAGLGFAVVALLGITFGTIYQKRHVTQIDLRVSALIQYCASLCVFLPAALLTEDMHVRWTGEFIFALCFLTLVLSIGAVLLLLGLIRAGAAARLASLFFLVPPTTALIAWMVFGESLSALAMLGVALTATGVAIVNRRPAPG